MNRGEAELQQVDPARAEGVQAHEEPLHEIKLAGHHGHLDHDVGDHPNSLPDQPQSVLDIGRALVGLDAEADLGEARVAQARQQLPVQAGAARVQARVHAGEQLPGALEEGHGLVGVEHRFPAGERHVAQPRARPRPGLQLPHGVAGRGGPAVEVGLVGVEAEEAPARAGEGHHEGLGSHPQPARLAGRGPPAGDQALPVVQHAHAERRQLPHGRLAAALAGRLRERHAEARHRLAKALLDVDVALRVAPKHRIGDAPDVRRRHLLDHHFSFAICRQPTLRPKPHYDRQLAPVKAVCRAWRVARQTMSEIGQDDIASGARCQ